jgi:molybdate transport system substrate-binding protein
MYFYTKKCLTTVFFPATVFIGVTRMDTDMKYMKGISALVCGFLIAATPAFAKPKQTEIIVAAAASLTNAMNDCIAAYTAKNPGIKITPTYGSSGSLQKQIEQGAPVDLFFSAAQTQMDALDKEGLLISGSRKNILENSVVLIVPAATASAVKTFNDLSLETVKKIALGEPSSVPVGQYSEQILSSLGILDSVKAKAVYAKDVRQVLTYVEQGEVDAGIVYATDAAISTKISIVAKAPAGSCKPVVYPAAVVKGSSHSAETQSFLVWLSSDTAGTLFAKYGFTLTN